MKSKNTSNDENDNYSLIELPPLKTYSDYTMSIIYAICAGFAFALSNSITAVLTQKYGPTGVYVNFIGGITAWALFHLLNGCF